MRLGFIFGLASVLAWVLAAVSVAAEPKYDILIRGGRIVDGTGAPWYAGDVAIDEGKIVRIGRLADAKADRVIDAAGLIVAPGFIDMMGQSATPMLENPETAMNLLTQGITTINAGEGYSAAPIAGDYARSEGWSTMMEYFQLLELRGLPVNVAQTVGHTQVRRLIIGDEDRKPSAEELTKMKALVAEAMEAGAIGLSTALIYPPAVYADTGEIGALAEVAGKYGGRYYTHMRNEGDRLLEAIDEALEIGRKGKTPVHIFHLKAAGRQNWSKMEEAVAKIKAARANGEQVTADIYPYINNGLGIIAMVHPRHFASGRDAFLAKIDDAELRKTVRREMESDEGDWENWFKHIGRDWEKLIAGRINSIRLTRYSGQSVAAIAKATKQDPWDIFFELVKTEAFVLPESMSEENKIRLMREEFISFCTDVGPAGGAGGTSHPRAFGSFPRILAKYVREGKAVSLEKAVGQASAVAANEVMAFDRGRIAEGLAADLIVFDFEKITDRATFGKPNELSVGMRYVVVNGQLVLNKGKRTNYLPGKVLRGPGYRHELAPHAVSTGTEVPELAGLDQVVAKFLERHRIPGASVAVTDQGRLVYARGFGYADLAKGERASAQSLFRIASISKPVTAAAVFYLIEQGKLKLDDKIFEILDHYQPPKKGDTIEKRLAGITIRNLLQHSGGWDRDKSFDAMFKSVPFSKNLGVPPPAGPDEVIRNMLAQALDFDPGTRQAYSNFGYCLLGRAIAKITGQDYQAFVKANILDPAGARTMRLGRSNLEHRQEGEVRYYSPHRGPSVFAENLGKKVPYPYGGWHLEAMDSHGAWLASAVDLARFASALDDHEKSPLLKSKTMESMFALPEGKLAYEKDGKLKKRFYGSGWRREDTAAGTVYSHGGSLAGTSTLLVKLPGRRNIVILFNARSGPGSRFFPNSLLPELEKAIDEVRTWPQGDQFAAFPKHTPKPRPEKEEASVKN